METQASNNIKHMCWVYNKIIPEKICDLIVDDFKDLNTEYGTLGENNEVDFKFRFVKKVQVPSAHWALGIVLYFGFDANAANFKYQVTNLSFTDFLTYEKGMFYCPHKDICDYVDAPGHNRKLTVIVQLTDENSYTGGDFILYDSILKPHKMAREKGSIIVFNSFLTHSVSKVTSGVRHSLCGWIIGPPFS